MKIATLFTRWIVYDKDGTPVFWRRGQKDCADYVSGRKLKAVDRKNGGYVFKYDSVDDIGFSLPPAELTSKQLRMQETCVDAILKGK